MGRLVELLGVAWLPGLLFAAGLAALAVWLRRRSEGSAALGWLVLGGAAAAVGLGGLTLPSSAGFWLTVAAGGLLFAKLIVLVITGHWFVIVGAVLGAATLYGLGGWLSRDTGIGTAYLIRTLAHSEFAQPWWLLLLLLLPAVVWMSYRSLAGLGPVRRWIAIGLRCLLVLLLTLALAEMRLRKPNDTTTVIFLVDRSQSVPQDIDPEDKTLVDRRWQRVKKFIERSVFERGSGHERDQAAVIAFGRRPKLVLPASDVPRVNLEDDNFSAVDTTYTDIAAAIKLALASFPEGTAKRIVLISDGNENLGNAEEQARIAKQNGVQIDVVPLASGYRNENEVLVERVEAPPTTEQGARLPIRVLVRSYNPRPVTGTLKLEQLSEGNPAVPVAVEAGPGVKERGPPAVVQLRPGLNAFSFKQSLAAEQRSYTYQAVFQPLESVSETGEVVRGLAGDRVQNNSASTHVVALGRRRVLFVEARGKAGEHDHLIQRLSGAGESKFQITAATSDLLPIGKTDLGVFLSNFDCVVLANVPAEEISEEQQEMIRSNTYDQGCGLVMIGGREGFGAGGYQNTPVEKALPVDCDIKSIKVAGKGGLVLVMHASEADNGNALQKQIAKLAISKLGPADMCGVIYYDFNHRWHVPFQDVGPNRASMLRQVDRMQPGDMMDFDPALTMATQELTRPKYNLATKHIIVISDGDPQLRNPAYLQQMKQLGVTCTTVGVATHGAPENTKMTQMATATGGKAYLNPPPRAIPAIYIKETRLVSQSFLYENRFAPRLQVAGGPTDKLSGPLPPLFGFVRTTLKQNPLVEMGIEGPPTLDQRFPILASWQYGLGKAVAFTSDARTAGEHLGWDREWAGSDMFLKFWEQVIGWALRGVETGKLSIASEYRDGKVRVTVSGRDDKNRPLTDLRLQGMVTAPNQPGGGKPIELKFEQKNSGEYEAEFKADEEGTFFINAVARRTVKQVKNGKEVEVEENDSIRSGVTLPYSPEFADLESNTALLDKLAAMTDGKVYEESTKALDDVVRRGEVFRKSPITAQSPQPMWYWLVLLAGIGLFFDVAVRRIAVEPAEVSSTATKLWERLRGRAETTTTTPFLERLQNRKAQVEETIGRTTRRFDAGDQPVITTPVETADAATSGRPARPPAAQSPGSPKPAEPAGDDPFARLMKAKKKALGDREAGPEPRDS
ncbi:MAG TPA: VWA domain-containing protein [Gemmataceae bacterium]|nr:VWA domain-containing protein [Gemmataceae bacterium]